MASKKQLKGVSGAPAKAAASACEASAQAHSGRIASLLLHPDGARAITTGGDGRIVVWDVDRLQAMVAIDAVSPENGVWHAVLVPSGRFLVAMEGRGWVGVWDLESGQRRARRQFAYGTHTVLAHPDGRRVLVVSAGHSEPNDITVWDFEADKEVACLSTEISVAVALLPDGKQVMVGDNCNGIELVGLPGAKSKVLQEPAGFGDDDEEEEDEDECVTAVAVSGDGRLGASGHDSGRLIVWDLKRGKRLHRVHAHRSEILAIAFHPDGKRLISSGGGGGLRVWDLESGKRLVDARPPGKSSGSDIQMHPGGRLCITSGSPSIDVWDLDAGAHVRRFAGHKEFTIARVHPDGARILSAGGDGLLKLWRLHGGTA